MTDDDLRRLIEDAVADVDPADRRSELFEALGARSENRLPVTGGGLRWRSAVAGALAAAAVLLGAFLLVPNATDRDTPPSAAEPTASAGGDPTGTGTAGTSVDSATADPSVDPRGTVPAYFVVDTDRAGTRLVREFQRVEGDRLTAAVALITSGAVLDPDYRTLWPGGGFASARYEESSKRIVLEPTEDVPADRPAGLDDDGARLALQQIVYTAQGVVHERVPVFFERDGEPVTVLGVDTAGGLTAAGLDVLNHVNITAPEQGQSIGADTLRVSGVANSFEANVAWELRDADGNAVRDGAATAEGYLGARLFPFAFTVDVASLPGGRYTIWTTTDDPTGGTEGWGAMTDDKAFDLVR